MHAHGKIVVYGCQQYVCGVLRVGATTGAELLEPDV